MLAIKTNLSKFVVKGMISNSDSLENYCEVTGFNRPLHEWHPTLNGDCLPEDVSLASRKKIVWKGIDSPDHVFITDVRERQQQFRELNEEVEQILRSNRDAPEHIIDSLCTIMSGNRSQRIMSGPRYGIVTEALLYYSADIILEPRIQDNPCSSRSPRQLSITNSTLGVNPELLNRLHPLLSEDGDECNHFEHSNHQLWRKCPMGPDHVWPASPNTTTLTTDGCWYCMNLQVSDIAMFAEVEDGTPQGISITNSVAGHPAFEHNMWGQNSQIPELVRSGSSRTLRNWICLEDAGHSEWPAVPNNRLLPDGTLGSGCMACFELERHRTQENLRKLIQENFPWLGPSDVPRNAFGLEYQGGGLPKFDIVLREDIRAVIEYQSEIHDTASRGKYRGEVGLQYRKDKDEEKRHLCKNAEPPVLLIEVWYRYSKSGPTWDQRSLESLLEVFAHYDFDPDEYRVVPGDSNSV